MPTLDEAFRNVLVIAMSVLRRDMEESFSKGLPAEDLLRLAFQHMLEKPQDYFWMCPWEVQDNEMFQTGVAVVYAHFVKTDEEMSERILKEFKALKAFAAVINSGLPVNLGHILDEFGDNTPLGLRKIFFDTKEKWEFETKTRPVIEQGERELEGKR